MVTIPVSRLRPGMIVAQAIVDDEVTIIGTGIILSGRHIAALKERGLESVAIAEDGEIDAVDVAAVAQSVQVDNNQISALAEELEGKIESLFADVMDDSVMVMISEKTKSFLLVKMQS